MKGNGGLHLLAGIAGWSLIVGGSLWWNIRNVEEQGMEMARAEVVAVRDKDMAFRRWALRHGGVYVQVTPEAQPAESLAHVPGRDVVTTEGQQLTLRAPAMMVREMMDLFYESRGVRGRIVGLRYLNPVNAPDDWERLQLETFERGERKEVWEIADLDGKPHLRYLQSWYMSEGCMKCHAILGYQVGDLRGATGANLPLAPYLENIRQSRNNLRFSHGAIWLLGLAGIGFSAALVRRRERELHDLNAGLETRVAERTAALAAQNARSSSIIHAAMDGFFIADLKGQIVDCNDVYCAMLGYSREQMLQLHVPQIDAVETPEEIALHIGRIFAAGHDRFDTRHRRSDGGQVDVEVNVTLASIDGERFFHVFVHDISQRKTDEAALISAREEAEQANAAKSEFLSRMSHELRTPLNAILGFAQLLALPGKNPLNEQQADSVKEIRQAGNHLLALVNEVLDLSRIESGRIELSLEAVELTGLVDACAAQVKPLAERRGIDIDVRIDPQVWVRSDHIRLRQVLLNLLSNAIKYNRKDGHIVVEARRQDETYRIEVADTGRGIAADKLGKLFKPFERLESSCDGIEGTGIGLALVKKLVEAMNGTLGVESEEGRGSVFWFTLPEETEGGGCESATAGPDATPPEKPAQAQEKHRVLYIEDNPANLKLMQKMLAVRGDIELREAASAELGLEMAFSTVPKVILLDINLPGMDGFEALKRLKAAPLTAGVAVVAVTANAMPKDIAHGKAAGFTHYLTKPIDIDRLYGILDDLCKDDCS